MNHPPLPWFRHSVLFWLGFLVILTGALVLTGPLPAQIEEEEEQPGGGPRFEEEEVVPKPKVPRRIDQPDAEDADDPGGPVDLAAAAARADNPLVRELLGGLARPFDRLVPTVGGPVHIEPFARRWSDLLGPTIDVVPLGQADRPEAGREFATKAIRRIEPYELVALEAVEKFLETDLSLPAEKHPLSRPDQLRVAEQALDAVLRFHRAAVETNRRAGLAWKEIGEQVDERLREIRQQQLERLIDQKEWDRAGRLAIRLGGEYPGDDGVIRDIYRLQLEKATDEARPDAQDDTPFRELREAVLAYERLPNVPRDSPLVKLGREKIRGRAEQLVRNARQFADDGRVSDALTLLLDAKSLDPELATIDALRDSLRGKYKILYVGMAGLPERMSPMSALSDPDRRAVELVFESLVKSVPDATLGRVYRPELAERSPQMVVGGRAFDLHTDVSWTGGDAPVRGRGQPPAEPFDARDVRTTLELLQERRHTRAGRAANMIQGVSIQSPTRLEVMLAHGTLEPRAAMEFKILPGRWLRQAGIDPSSPAFGNAPVGTGPYVCLGRQTEVDGRECVVFRANPVYGRRPGKRGLPAIQEIRFFDNRETTDPSSDYKSGRLHIQLDIPTRDLGLHRVPDVDTFTVREHRRIHFLAVNHRRAPLRNRDLRRGLAMAIDRETILNEVFRNDDPEAHRALQGPFPPNSWANPEGANPIFDEELARALLRKEADSGRTMKFELIYDAGDESANEACVRIKDAIESASQLGDDTPATVEIELQPLERSRLYERVEGNHAYDLAYYDYDFADPLYRLGDLFDPTATGPAGRNFMGWTLENAATEDRPLLEKITRASATREFPKLKLEMSAIHTLFNDRMPFIPLWHLDQNGAVHRSAQLSHQGKPITINPQYLNPATFFTDVEAWKLK